MFVGYARVSTNEQETHLQLDALDRAGAIKIYQEKRSAVSYRPALERMLQELQPGHVVLVYKMDRLARSLRDLLQILDRIEAADARFRSLTEPIDTETLAGRMMMQMLGAFAEFERGMIRERTIAGMRAAVDRGARLGRYRNLSPEDEADLVRMYLEGDGFYSMQALANVFGVSLATTKRAIYRVTKPGHSSLR
ncbi:MAG: recombinase family protein [Hylemonella sp.]|uniref:recombinase family protein n=1 Tax=Hylemonella sp. TaxID=2066020 RepID=UPI0022CA7D39|nr:recombinase family protein [Hylemonella sp.]MCZ8252253.1 recombinase family protein [Hylemonella sp.]